MQRVLFGTLRAIDGSAVRAGCGPGDAGHATGLDATRKEAAIPDPGSQVRSSSPFE
jgi:hypothetical protein